jgi:hypothetical protein
MLAKVPAYFGAYYVCLSCRRRKPRNAMFFNLPGESQATRLLPKGAELIQGGPSLNRLLYWIFIYGRVYSSLILKLPLTLIHTARTP